MVMAWLGKKNRGRKSDKGENSERGEKGEGATKVTTRVWDEGAGEGNYEI